MPVRRVRRIASQIADVLRRNGLPGLYRYCLAKLWLIRESLLHGQTEYENWCSMNRYAAPTPLASGSKLSIVTPVFNPPIEILQHTISSVFAQTSPNWEYIIVNAGEIESDQGRAVLELLEATAARDERCHLICLDKNLGISENLNVGISHASGDFVLVLDHDDTIDPVAVAEIAEAYETNPSADIIYFDEDRMTADGSVRCQPWFKPQTRSPEYLLNACYLMHSAIRREKLLDLGGFRSMMDGAQDWDLYLQLSRQNDQEVHIPKLLYHWRQTEGSAALTAQAKPWALEAQERALAQHLSVVASVNVKIVWDERGLPKPNWTPPNASIAVLLHGPQSSSAGQQSVKSATAPGKIECHTFDPSTFQDLLPKLDCDLLLFLDSRAQSLDAAWIMELVQWAMLPEVGVVGGIAMDSNGFVARGGQRESGNETIQLFRSAPIPCHTPYGSLEHVRNSSSVSASCMMVRRSVALNCARSSWSDAVPNQALSESAKDLGLRTVWTPHAQIVLPSIALKPNAGAWQSSAGDKIDSYYNPNLDGRSSVPRLNMTRRQL